MMPHIQPEILSREFVKPFSTTPKHKGIHKLCFFDQLSPRLYVPLLLFYTKEAGHKSSDFYHRSHLLKQSLSQALSRYYPLAGRIQGDATIDCNDEGIMFLEARIQCELQEILKHPAEQTIKSLFPDDLQYKDSILGSRLVLQVTSFDCGGMAIAICICHKTLDAAGLSSFVNDWAAMSRGIVNSPEEVSPVLFNLASVCPPIELPTINHGEFDQVKTGSRRLVFDALSIAKLKSLVADKVQNPTRVELVSALIYMAAISAARKSSGSSNLTIMHHAVDMRKRVSSILPRGCEGNLTAVFPVSTAEDTKIDLVWLVEETRRQEMALFEHDKNLLAFACINPTT
uniref:Salutaridinol 7-O-acetyltransferase n=1 Tax=Turnera subulata TaxID=218843 RepID=A0A516IJJ2_9ROSI